MRSSTAPPAGQAVPSSALGIVIVDATITSNRSGAGGNGEDDGGDGGRGGAIWTSGSLQVTNSTLSDNRTGPGGQDQVGFETNGVPGKGGAGGAIWVRPASDHQLDLL